MCKSWFYPLSEKPCDALIDDVLAECHVASMAEHSVETYLSSRERYDIYWVKHGVDRMRIVVGCEPESPNPNSKIVWWILATCEPWWRSGSNRLPKIVIPVLNAKLAETPKGTAKAVSDSLERGQ